MNQYKLSKDEIKQLDLMFGELKKDSREALAEKLIENEEDIIEKKLQEQI